MQKKIAKIIIAVLFPLFIFSNCENSNSKQDNLSQYTSFLDIPGITEDEIRAIKAFQEQNISFTYGMTPISEAFQTDSGEFKGFAALFCEWLTEFFGIQFMPALYDWDDLLTGLESGGIEFTGELTATDERRKTYIMTDAIAGRTLKSLRVINATPLDEIARLRPLRYIFLRGSTTADAAHAALAHSSYETLLVDSVYHAYALLKDGDADLFVNEGIGETDFNTYGNFVSSDFSPIIFETVSMSTQTPALEPFISVVQKMLDNGGIRYLTRLYNQGDLDYIKNKLQLSLIEEELAYIRESPVVRFAAERDNYPISFYNAREKQWQGIVFDVLSEIENITGIRFERVNDHHTEFPALFNMLENGEASMISELIRSDEREGRFLWPQTPVFSNNYALLSKTDIPNVKLNEIIYSRVGLIKGTAHASSFRMWFPSHMNTSEYETAESAFEALMRDEIDMVMARQSRLLDLLNYREMIGFKTNILFDGLIDSTFGFHKNEIVLCSIVDKALPLIDTRRISEQWTQKTYDYRVKIIEAQRPWLIGAVILMLGVIVLMFVLFRRTNFEEKRLEKLVHQRTIVLNTQNALMKVINDTAAMLMDSGVEDYSEVVNKSMKMICQCVEVDRVFLFQNTRKNDGKLYYKQVCQWTEGIMDTENELGEYSYVPNWEKRLSCGEHLNGSMDKFPEEGGIEYFKLYGIVSLLAVPLFIRGEFWGFVSFDDCRRQRVFDQGEAYVLQSWGLLIVGAIQRNKLTFDMRQALIRAEEASMSKSQFLANMSHEIRTPMNAILGITEIMLQKDILENELKEALGKIYSSGDLLLNIINDILDLSKIEAGKLEISPVQYEISSMLNDTTMLNMMRIGSKPIVFELSVDENIPATLIGDELRIKQILNNMLTNAFKYTKEGTVKLSVSAEKGESESSVTLICTVSDTGQGMTREQMSRLFNNEYIRFNTESNRTTEGTGLGMSITYNLVELMNGTISVESEHGKGSVFTVRLPQKINSSGILGMEMAQRLEKMETSGRKQLNRAHILFEPMPYGSILVVDDMEANLYVAKGLMAPYGIKIDTAESGFEAVEKIKSGKVYDIVFMDHMMPVMDGIETVKNIRETGYDHPIVALTANAVVGQADVFLKNGFNGFISKPIDTRQLNAMLNKFIRDKQPPEVLASVTAAPTQPKEADAPAWTDELLKELTLIDDLDVETGLKYAGHNRENYFTVMRYFTEKCGDYMEKLEMTKEAEDWKNYTIHAHALKGVLASFGADKLSQAAARLEKASRTGNSFEPAICLDETAAFNAELSKFRSNLEGTHLMTTPPEDGKDDKPEGDIKFLKKQAKLLKKACLRYSFTDTKEIIAVIKGYKWSSEAEKELENIRSFIVSFDYDKALEGIERLLQLNEGGIL